MHGLAGRRQKHVLPVVETFGLRSGALQRLRTIPVTDFRNGVETRPGRPESDVLARLAGDITHRQRSYGARAPSVHDPLTDLPDSGTAGAGHSVHRSPRGTMTAEGHLPARTRRRGPVRRERGDVTREASSAQRHAFCYISTHESDRRRRRRTVAGRHHAARECMTLKAAFEQALRQLLAGPAAAGGGTPPIPVFDGQGVQPDVDLTKGVALRNIMDADH